MDLLRSLIVHWSPWFSTSFVDPSVVSVMNQKSCIFTENSLLPHCKIRWIQQFSLKSCHLRCGHSIASYSASEFQTKPDHNQQLCVFQSSNKFRSWINQYSNKSFEWMSHSSASPSPSYWHNNFTCRNSHWKIPTSNLYNILLIF